MYSASGKPANMRSRCYTNHALDQFLEHLLPITRNVVRMGSRSKSSQLDQYNLNNLIKTASTTANSTRAAQGRLHKLLEEYEAEGTQLCKNLINPFNVRWENVADFLKEKYYHHFLQLSSTFDEDGFVQVVPRRQGAFNYWRSGKDLDTALKFNEVYGGAAKQDTQQPTRDIGTLLLSDLWTFTRRERTILINHWLKELRQSWIDEIIVSVDSQKKAIRELEALFAESNRQVLEQADVIGITTTNLAKNAELLSRVRSKTLICEEAGEVLEVTIYICISPV